MSIDRPPTSASAASDAPPSSSAGDKASPFGSSPFGSTLNLDGLGPLPGGSRVRCACGVVDTPRTPRPRPVPLTLRVRAGEPGVVVQRDQPAAEHRRLQQGRPGAHSFDGRRTALLLCMRGAAPAHAWPLAGETVSSACTAAAFSPASPPTPSRRRPPLCGLLSRPPAAAFRAPQVRTSKELERVFARRPSVDPHSLNPSRPVLSADELTGAPRGRAWAAQRGAAVVLMPTRVSLATVVHPSSLWLSLAPSFD